MLQITPTLIAIEVPYGSTPELVGKGFAPVQWYVSLDWRDEKLIELPKQKGVEYKITSTLSDFKGIKDKRFTQEERDGIFEKLLSKSVTLEYTLIHIKQ